MTTAATCPQCGKPTDDEAQFCAECDPITPVELPEAVVTYDLSAPCGDEIPTNDPCWRI